MSSKTNKKGRNSYALSDFIALERYLLRTVAWRSLKALARAAYIEICFCFDGKNNGRIQMSARNLGDRLGVDKATASRALKELEANGSIVIVRKSHFSQKLKTRLQPCDPSVPPMQPTSRKRRQNRQISCNSATIRY